MTDRAADAAILDRARGALLGLAIGDALGMPADVHRSVREPWPRGAVWRNNAALDTQRVSRPLLPFAAALTGITGIVPTDDTETAAVAALAVLESGCTDDLDALFGIWLRHHAADDAWLGVAARSAVLNSGLGLRPPITGSDNPAHYDDSAVPAAVAIALAVSDPAHAGSSAAAYASITNADDGIEAARVMAVLIAGLLGGAELETAITGAISAAPQNGWLAANLAVADEIVAASQTGSAGAGGAFAALPELIERLSPRNYSHAGVAAETLPLALAIVRLTDAHPAQAIPLALAIARKADSLPAFVGAICGARWGRSRLGANWDHLDVLDGVLLPSVAGVRLSELAADLVAVRSPGAAG